MGDFYFYGFGGIFYRRTIKRNKWIHGKYCFRVESENQAGSGRLEENHVSSLNSVSSAMEGEGENLPCGSLVRIEKHSTWPRGGTWQMTAIAIVIYNGGK